MKLYFEMAVDQKTKARDQTFQGKQEVHERETRGAREGNKMCTRGKKRCA